MIKQLYIRFRKLISSEFGYKTISFNSSEVKSIWFHSHKYYNQDKSHLAPKHIKGFEHLNNWQDEGYILKVDQPLIIEPNFGWAISLKNRLILPSIPYAYRKEDWAWQPLPNRIDTWRLKRWINVSEVVSFNNLWRYGPNYFQFINTFLVQLVLYRGCQECNGLPIIVPAKLYNSGYFQSALRILPILKEQEYIVQDKEWIKCKKAYFIKAIPYRKEHLIEAISWFPKPKGEVINNRLFLTRSEKRIRHLRNKAEIEAIVVDLGFTVIDTDDMSFLEQIQTFSNAKWVIGIHGAGLANLIFRYPRELNLFEILSEDYIAGGYFLMASSFGWNYDGIIGDSQKNDSFLLDPLEFKNRVSKWLMRGNED